MSKKLVLYFSVYGTAKAVAEEIARQTGADLMEIKPVVPYDSDRNHYNALAKLAKKNTTRISVQPSGTPSPSRSMIRSIWAIPCGGILSR